jgi:hypothetical protein
MAQDKNSKVNLGLGVDSTGGPVIDPTANVIALTEAAVKRQDDLREASENLNALQIACQKEIGDLREKHSEVIRVLQAQHLAELGKAESERLNAIRQVDREEGAKTAAQLLSAVTTLATQNQSTAETLRNQVAQTAETLRNQVATTQMASQNTFNTTVTEFNKRISQLELSSSEGKGRQTLSDPAMEQLVAEMRSLSASRAGSSGRTEGIERLIGWLVAIGAIIFAFIKH